MKNNTPEEITLKEAKKKIIKTWLIGMSLVVSIPISTLITRWLAFKKAPIVQIEQGEYAGSYKILGDYKVYGTTKDGLEILLIDGDKSRVIGDSKKDIVGIKEVCKKGGFYGVRGDLEEQVECGILKSREWHSGQTFKRINLGYSEIDSLNYTIMSKMGELYRKVMQSYGKSQ